MHKTVFMATLEHSLENNNIWFLYPVQSLVLYPASEHHYFGYNICAEAGILHLYLGPPVCEYETLSLIFELNAETLATMKKFCFHTTLKNLSSY
jgi:hypothetical protein